MARLSGVFVAALLLAAIAVLPAGAQTYAPATFSVSDSTVVPGETITLSGSNAAPGATVTITLNGAVVATAIADDEGNWSTPFTVPSDLAVGTHTLTASDGSVSTSTTIEVVSAAGASAEGEQGALPFTGSDNSPDYIRWALGTIGVGGVLVAYGRHRRARRGSAVAA